MCFAFLFFCLPLGLFETFSDYEVCWRSLPRCYDSTSKPLHTQLQIVFLFVLFCKNIGSDLHSVLLKVLGYILTEFSEPISSGWVFSVPFFLFVTREACSAFEHFLFFSSQSEMPFNGNFLEDYNNILPLAFKLIKSCFFGLWSIYHEELFKDLLYVFFVWKFCRVENPCLKWSKINERKHTARVKLLYGKKIR